jgi:large subunit ribosomal protein L3
MAIGLLGRKVGMTQIFDESGNAVPVTVIEAGPCHVLQLRTTERDGYEAVQLGFLDKPRRLASRSRRGQVAKLDSKRSKKRAKAGIEPLVKAGCEPQTFVREFRGPAGEIAVGQTLDVNVFADVKRVDVVGTSKGRGTAGVMVRHNFSGQRATHGVKKVHRHAGSIGQSQFPGHVPKGRRMAGQHGNVQRTARNLQVVRIDAENNLLLVGGAIPGPNGGYVVINDTNMLK